MNDNSSVLEVTPQKIINFLKRYLVVFLGVPAIVLLGTVIYLQLCTPTYQSTSRVELGQFRIDPNDFEKFSYIMTASDATKLLKDTSFQEKVAIASKVPFDLTKKILEAGEVTNDIPIFLDLKVTHTDPKIAQDVLLATVDEMLIIQGQQFDVILTQVRVNQEFAKKSLETNAQLIDVLSKRLKDPSLSHDNFIIINALTSAKQYEIRKLRVELRDAESLLRPDRNFKSKIAEKATLTSSPNSPNKSRALILNFIFSVLIAYFISVAHFQVTHRTEKSG